MAKSKSGQIPGLFIVIENGNLRGLKNCCDDLAKRGVPAAITLGEDAIDKDAGLVKDLAGRGFDICGKLAPEFHGDQPFEYQLEQMRRELDKFRQCTKQPLRGVTARHFVHNEATIRVAHELKLDYVLIRGTGGIDAIVYKPKEFATKVISASMMPAMDKGLGSLCEHIIWAGGQAPEDFKRILFGLKAQKVTLGIHTVLGAAKLRWWTVYQDFLNADLVAWKPLDEFGMDAKELPASQIPRNMAITYEAPRPQIPMDKEPEYQTQ